MQQKQFMWLLDLASLLEAVGVDGAPAGDTAGRRPPLLAPLVMWGYVFSSVRSSYTTALKFKPRSSPLRLNALVEEQASYRHGWDGQRVKCIVVSPVV
jgi:hypothetical protein